MEKGKSLPSLRLLKPSTKQCAKLLYLAEGRGDYKNVFDTCFNFHEKSLGGYSKLIKVASEKS